MTKEKRFDIDTLWGQKELIGYLALFLRNAWALEEIIESAYIVTMGVSFNLFQDDEADSGLQNIRDDFFKDSYILEKIALFDEVFKLKC